MVDLTVVTTLLNEEKHILQFIDSLARQTEKNFNVVLVDGGSVDRTCAIINANWWKLKSAILICDPTASLRFSKGPIGRGRNIAIGHSNTRYIVCADVGCEYDSDWISNIKAAIGVGLGVVSGGTILNQEKCSIWDKAFAPFLGFDLCYSADGSATATGTARALGFPKALWAEVGGFSEATLTGEDTQFFQKLIKRASPMPVYRAAALYAPRYTLWTGLNRCYRYAQGDGAQRIGSLRALRMLARIAIAALIPASAITISAPSALTVLSVFALSELTHALRFDFSKLITRRPVNAVVCTRLCVSLMVPYVFVLGYISGLMSGHINNEQNQS